MFCSIILCDVLLLSVPLRCVLVIPSITAVKLRKIRSLIQFSYVKFRR